MSGLLVEMSAITMAAFEVLKVGGATSYVEYIQWQEHYMVRHQKCILIAAGLSGDLESFPKIYTDVLHSLGYQWPR